MQIYKQFKSAKPFCDKFNVSIMMNMNILGSSGHPRRHEIMVKLFEEQTLSGIGQSAEFRKSQHYIFDIGL